MFPSLKYTAIVTVSLLTGCAALEPNSIRPELGHVSHASQHFGSHPTNYGFDTAVLVAHWQAHSAYIDVSEGYVIERKEYGACGALWGGHEVFQARVGYEFKLK